VNFVPLGRLGWLFFGLFGYVCYLPGVGEFLDGFLEFVCFLFVPYVVLLGNFGACSPDLTNNYVLWGEVVAFFSVSEA
jgi:hypothetical protein